MTPPRARRARRVGQRAPRGGRARRGASLVELLVAVALFTLVCTLGAAIVRSQRAALGVLAGATHTRAALRHAAAALELDLRAAAASQPPTVAGDSAVELLVPIADGVVCAVADDGRELLLRPRRRAAAGAVTLWRTHPEPGDVLLALVRADSAGGRWERAEVHEVGESVANACVLPFAPADGTDAASLVVRVAVPLPADAGHGTVVRVLRRMRYALYRSGDGSWQLGQRRCAASATGTASGCGGVQPVAGPLASYSSQPHRTGLRVQLVDAAGAPATPATTHALRATLRAPRSPRAPIALHGTRAPGTGRDSVALWIAMRNRP